jgi:hypothetical protein
MNKIFVAKHVKYQKKTNDQSTVLNESNINVNKNAEKSENV